MQTVHSSVLMSAPGEERREAEVCLPVSCVRRRPAWSAVSVTSGGSPLVSSGHSLLLSRFCSEQHGRLHLGPDGRCLPYRVERGEEGRRVVATTDIQPGQLIFR